MVANVRVFQCPTCTAQMHIWPDYYDAYVKLYCEFCRTFGYRCMSDLPRGFYQQPGGWTTDTEHMKAMVALTKELGLTKPKWVD
jgi:hypothetical protein